jgi:hypothetical protein
MTNLDKKPVKRETRAVDNTRSGRRPLIVLLDVGGRLVRIKPKGTRQWYTVAYEDIYRLGIRNRAAELKAEKAARKGKAK